jgi:hypothetical protein
MTTMIRSLRLAVIALPLFLAGYGMAGQGEPGLVQGGAVTASNGAR